MASVVAWAHAVARAEAARAEAATANAEFKAAAGAKKEADKAETHLAIQTLQVSQKDPAKAELLKHSQAGIIQAAVTAARVERVASDGAATAQERADALVARAVEARKQVDHARRGSAGSQAVERAAEVYEREVQRVRARLAREANRPENAQTRMRRVRAARRQRTDANRSRRALSRARNKNRSRLTGLARMRRERDIDGAERALDTSRARRFTHDKHRASILRELAKKQPLNPAQRRELRALAHGALERDAELAGIRRRAAARRARADARLPLRRRERAERDKQRRRLQETLDDPGVAEETKAEARKDLQRLEEGAAAADGQRQRELEKIPEGGLTSTEGEEVDDLRKRAAARKARLRARCEKCDPECEFYETCVCVEHPSGPPAPEPADPNKPKKVGEGAGGGPVITPRGGLGEVDKGDRQPPPDDAPWNPGDPHAFAWRGLPPSRKGGASSVPPKGGYRFIGGRYEVGGALKPAIPCVRGGTSRRWGDLSQTLQSQGYSLQIDGDKNVSIVSGGNVFTFDKASSARINAVRAENKKKGRPFYDPDDDQASKTLVYTCTGRAAFGSPEDYDLLDAMRSALVGVRDAFVPETVRKALVKWGGDLAQVLEDVVRFIGGAKLELLLALLNGTATKELWKEFFVEVLGDIALGPAGVKLLGKLFAKGSKAARRIKEALGKAARKVAGKRHLPLPDAKVLEGALDDMAEAADDLADTVRRGDRAAEAGAGAGHVKAPEASNSTVGHGRAPIDEVPDGGVPKGGGGKGGGRPRRDASPGAEFDGKVPEGVEVPAAKPEKPRRKSASSADEARPPRREPEAPPDTVDPDAPPPPGEVRRKRSRLRPPRFPARTVDDAIASSRRAASPQISEGARGIAKKLGHAEAQGFESAFKGLQPTQANAERLIRDILENPSRVIRADRVVDVYDALGRGIRLDRGTNGFRGFLEGALETR